MDKPSAPATARDALQPRKGKRRVVLVSLLALVLLGCLFVPFSESNSSQSLFDRIRRGFDEHRRAFDQRRRAWELQRRADEQARRAAAANTSLQNSPQTTSSATPATNP